MLEKINVILISGKAGVGKSTFARMIQANILEGIDDFPSHVIVMPFASEVKRMATLMDWDGKKDERGRRFLQQLGDVARQYDRDTWARKAYLNMQDKYFQYSGRTFIAIVDDWRFYNEKFFLESCKCNLYCVRIEAPNREILLGTPEYNHVSETELPSGLEDSVYADEAYDYVLDNTGSLESLESSAKTFVSQIRYWVKVEEEVDE